MLDDGKDPDDYGPLIRDEGVSWFRLLVWAMAGIGVIGLMFGVGNWLIGWCIRHPSATYGALGVGVIIVVCVLMELCDDDDGDDTYRAGQ